MLYSGIDDDDNENVNEHVQKGTHYSALKGTDIQISHNNACNIRPSSMANERLKEALQ